MDRRVKIETAILAKQKGFTIDNPTTEYVKGFIEEWDVAMDDVTGDYLSNNFLGYKETEIQEEDHSIDGRGVIPTQTSLQTWLREQHNCLVLATSHTLKSGIWGDYTVTVDSHFLNDARDEDFQKFEDALEFGLIYALKKMKDVL